MLAALVQVRMRSIWDKYYADAHGVIFVVDAADVARFEEAKLAFCEYLTSPAHASRRYGPHAHMPSSTLPGMARVAPMDDMLTDHD